MTNFDFDPTNAVDFFIAFDALGIMITVLQKPQQLKYDNDGVGDIGGDDDVVVVVGHSSHGPAVHELSYNDYYPLATQQ